MKTDKDLEQAGQELTRGLSISIGQYLRILSKWKWLIVAIFVLVVGAVALFTFSRTRYYAATATVLVQRRAPQVLGSDVHQVVDLSMGNYWRGKEYMETQRKVVMSRALVQKVVRRLQLHKSVTFWKPLAPKQAPRARSVAETAGRLLGLMKVVPVRDANILEITVEHPTPELAPRLANAVAAAFISHNLEYKLSSTTSAVKWLADQLDDLKAKLKKSDRSLYEFKKKHNIVSVSFEDKQTLIRSRIAKINDALTEIRIKRIAVGALLRQARKASKASLGASSADPALRDATVQQLKESVMREEAKHVALLQRYGEKHPKVQQSAKRLAAIKANLKSETNNVLVSIAARYRRLGDNENKLAAALQQAKDQAMALNKRELDYRRLKRENNYIGKLYGSVLSRTKETDLSAQLKVNNIHMLDAAVISRVPVRPRVHLNLLIAALLGLLLGVAGALLADALDSSVKSQDDLTQVPNLVFLGMMPRIPGTAVARSRKRHTVPNADVDLIVHRSPKSSVAESCRAIRTNLLFALPDQRARKIVVTSPGPREGKTTTTVSLGIAMAQAGSRTLIVDTDMRRPRLHKVFQVPGQEGLTTALLGDADMSQLIKATEAPGLSILPCGPTPPNPAELCHSARFKELINGLTEDFDVVILDSPPIMAVTDAVILSTLVDGTLLVARTGQTSRAALRAACSQIDDVGARMLGCVLNDMDLEKHAYRYYRYRRYGYGYGYYREEEEEATS